MENPEANCCHCHGVAAHHPYFMGYYIFFMDCSQAIQSGDEPETGHEHEQSSFPKTSFGKEGHVKTGWRTKKENYKDIYLT